GRVLMVRLNGYGKTTSSAKLALLLKKHGRNPALIAVDLQRPAAIEHLPTLGKQIDVPLFTPEPSEKEVRRAAAASLQWMENADVKIFDTAGRQEIDQPLVEELKQLRDFLQPQEILLVADGATGQQAVSVATQFNDALQINGTAMNQRDG